MASKSESAARKWFEQKGAKRSAKFGANYAFNTKSTKQNKMTAYDTLLTCVFGVQYI